MLKERRELLERECKKAHDEAANMYLSIVVSNGDVGSVEYQKLRNHIADLHFELDMVNRLIFKGHE